MIYRIGKKYYIRVQGYYKELDVKIDGDNLEFTPNGNEIEVTTVKEIETLNPQTQKEDIIKSLKKRESKTSMEETTIRKYHKYDNRI